MALKDVCALLAASSLGAGAVVTVPAVHQPTRDKIASAAGYQPRKPARVKAHRTAAQPVPKAEPSAGIADCPIPGLSATPSLFPNFAGTPPGGALSSPQSLHPHPGDHFAVAPAIPEFPITNPIPEPDSWLMFIAGFGLLGFSLRRRKKSEGKSV